MAIWTLGQFFCLDCFPTVGSSAKEKLLADFHRMDKELGGGSIQPNFMDLHTYIDT